MRLLGSFENPWCLFSLLLMIVLLLMGGALVSLSRQRERARHQGAKVRRASAVRPDPVAASGPFEGLQGIVERLAEVERHLPPDSADARWLQSYRNDLRNVLDDLYWRVREAPEQERGALLEQLSGEVERLERALQSGLSASLRDTTDRDALREQLEQLRQALGG